MSSPFAEAIYAVYAAAVEHVHAGRSVSRYLRRIDETVLRIAGVEVRAEPRSVYLIAIGKASVGMSTAAVDELGDLLAAGIVVTKDEADPRLERLTVMHGSHPVPDGRSLDAGEAVLRFARSIPRGATVICLISGGGSSLVEALRADVTLSELRRVTLHLLGRGAAIQELNAARSRLSRFKAGGLLRELSHTHVHNLIVSDVLGDSLEAIASGPTVLPAAVLDAAEVLAAYDVETALPEPERDIRLAPPETTVIANVSAAIDAAAEHAAFLGFTPFIVSRSLEGEAREVGRLLASMVKDSTAGRTTWTAGTCLIAGGETVVTLAGHGIGGRNTEAALAAALALRGTPTSAIGFLATDGDDGVSGAAGAIVDGDTLESAAVGEALAALRDNDSYTWLQHVGATITTGPSGTNVNDLVIAIIGD